MTDGDAQRSEMRNLEVQITNLRRELRREQEKHEHAQSNNFVSFFESAQFFSKAKKTYAFTDNIPVVRKTLKYPDPNPYDENREALKRFLYKLKIKLHFNFD